MILNLVNGKVYIGQTTKDIQVRWKEHLVAARMGKPWTLYNAIRKYGAENLKIVTLHQAFRFEELNEMEIRAIWSHEANNSGFGYNMTKGGKGVSEPSVEARKNMSAGQKQRFTDDGEIQKASIRGKAIWADVGLRSRITASMKVERNTIGGRERLSRIARDAWTVEDFRDRQTQRLQDLGRDLDQRQRRSEANSLRTGNKHPMFGKHHSSKSRALISASRGGIQATRELGETGYRGVRKCRDTYQARIYFKTILHHLGTFITPEEAALAYNRKAVELYGNSAILNTVEQQEAT